MAKAQRGWAMWLRGHCSENGILRTKVLEVKHPTPLTKLRPSARKPAQAHERQHANIYGQIQKVSFNFWFLLLLATWLAANALTFLCLSFLICQIWILIVFKLIG